MSVATIVFLALSAFFSAVAVLFMLTGEWYSRQAYLWRISPATARARKHRKPWYVRHCDRFLS